MPDQPKIKHLTVIGFAGQKNSSDYVNAGKVKLKKAKENIMDAGNDFSRALEKTIENFKAESIVKINEIDSRVAEIKAKTLNAADEAGGVYKDEISRLEHSKTLLLAKLEENIGTRAQAISTEVKEYDVIVAGGGPAGVSAAIYSARKGLKVALVAEHIGGQVAETVAIENMISVPQTTGSHLVANLKSHLNEYAIDILENRRIDHFEITDGKKQIKTSMGETLATPALIIATGASWRRLNVPGESQYIGSGVAF